MRGAAAQHVEKITDGGTGGRRDDADADGVGWEGFFAGGVEESLGTQFFLQGAQFRFQLTGPVRLHASDDDLVLSAGFVNGKFSE